MALLNISSAARAAGKDRNTVKRYLKDGRLTGTRDASGKTVIDTTELMRVFGSLVTDGSTGAPVDRASSSPENTTIHQLTIETLVQQLQAAQEREKAALGREEWLRSQLAAEQERTRALELKMLPPGEPGQGEKKGFFARIFGK